MKQLLTRQINTIAMNEAFQTQNEPDSLANKYLKILKVKTTYNWWGKMLNFLFQPPHLIMEFLTQDGKKTTYRTVPILLNKGIIINAKIDNVEEMQQFFEHRLPASKTIKNIQFKERTKKIWI